MHTTFLESRLFFSQIANNSDYKCEIDLWLEDLAKHDGIDSV